MTVHDRVHDPALEETAHSAHATYVEVALLIDDLNHLNRLHGRRPTNDVQARVQAALMDRGSDLVDKIRRHLSEYLAMRPGAIRLDTTGLEPETTYQCLLSHLNVA